MLDLERFTDNITDVDIVQHDNNSPVSPEEYHASNLADAATFLLVQLNAPEQVLRLWPALTGLMAGRATIVTFYRLDVARRLFGRGYMSADECKRVSERVSNYLGAMRDWVHREGLTDIVRYEPGDKDTPNRLTTPILKWVVELAAIAGERLTPDSPDDQRRVIFKHEAVNLLRRKRLTTRRKPDGQRVKRMVAPSTQMKQIKSLIQNFYMAKMGENLTKDVKVEIAETQVKSFILSELEGYLGRLCRENSVGENARIGSGNNYHQLNIDDEEKEPRGGARKKPFNAFSSYSVGKNSGTPEGGR